MTTPPNSLHDAQRIIRDQAAQIERLEAEAKHQREMADEYLRMANAARRELATAREDALREVAAMIREEIDKRMPQITQLGQDFKNYRVPSVRYRILREGVDVRQSIQDRVLNLIAKDTQ